MKYTKRIDENVKQTFSAYSEFRRKQQPPPKVEIDTNYYGPGVLGILAQQERERLDALVTGAEVLP